MHNAVKKKTMTSQAELSEFIVLIPNCLCNQKRPSTACTAALAAPETAFSAELTAPLTVFPTPVAARAASHPEQAAGYRRFKFSQVSIDIRLRVLTVLTRRLALPAKHPASEMGSAPAWMAAETHPTAVGAIATAQPIEVFCQHTSTTIRH